MEYPMFHHFASDISNIPLPDRFTYPFCYVPHPLCTVAAYEVQEHLRQYDKGYGTEEGKMFGVLTVRTAEGDVGYLAAFSGIWHGSNRHPFFVPPVYDLLSPEGFFRQEEKEISHLNVCIHALENNPQYTTLKQLADDTAKSARASLEQARIRLKEAKATRDLRRQSTLSPEEEEQLKNESRFQKAELKRMERQWKVRTDAIEAQLHSYKEEEARLKAERKRRSAALQTKLFRQFVLLNAKGERRNLCDIFAHTPQGMPPAGAGECAAPKLLQQAYLHGWQPLCMAEFWWGPSPENEVRLQGHYYPACKGKCGPILNHMLQGLKVEANPLVRTDVSGTDILYDDPWLAVINKPSGLLSVPGKEEDMPSVYSLMRKRYPQAEGPLIVHRLDMDTSGLMVIAKTKQVHRQLQADFEHRLIEKKYMALLDGTVENEHGLIDLPLCPDPTDRPRQMVHSRYGKPSLTRYEVAYRKDGRTLVAFYPLTGRTHQLRVHAAHPQGLRCPIAGDRLYGKPSAPRLCLHAESIEFTHPVTKEKINLHCKGDFY